MKIKNFELKDIEAGCKFVTRGGEEVKNLFDDGHGEFFCIGGEIGEQQEWWSKGGKCQYSSNGDDSMDLMTVIDDVKPYSKPESEYAVGNYVAAIEEANRSRIPCGGEANESMPPQSAITNHVLDALRYVTESIKNDPVNKPSHYTDGQIDVIDFIDDKGFDYCIGNAIKYLSRAGKKQNEIEDLEKAVWYINHKIKKLKDEGTKH